MECWCLRALRETPERAWCEKPDASNRAPCGIPARTETQMRKKDMDTGICLRLIVEDLDTAVLQRRRVVERDLVERAVLRGSRPIPHGEVVDEIDDSQQDEQSQQCPGDDEPRASQV